MPGIIAAIDGSGHSQRALEWAVGEAAARHLPLVAITVYRTVGGAWGRATVYPDDPVLAEPAREAAQAQVDEALARSGGSRPASVEVRAVSGNPAHELFNAAEDAAMIVVGSRGTGGFARLPLGSVASHLAHHAHCPFVIIPAGPQLTREVRAQDRDLFHATPIGSLQCRSLCMTSSRATRTLRIFSAARAPTSPR